MSQAPDTLNVAKPTVDPLCVLIVDDDATILHLLKDVMSSVPGVRILTASQPLEAMQILSREPVDIVFTDVHMPGVTGIEMIRDMVALQKTPEVVVMTAYPSGEIAQQAMELGATSLLAKPFENISLVEEELSKAMERVKKQRAARPEVEQIKEEIKARGGQEEDTDPPMKVSLPELPSIPVPVGSLSAEPEAKPEVLESVAKPAVTEAPPVTEATEVDVLAATAEVPVSAAKPSSQEAPSSLFVHPAISLESVVHIEIARARLAGRSFHLAIVDLPDELSLFSSEEVMAERGEMISKVGSLLKSTDALFDMGRNGLAILCFDSDEARLNELGSQLGDLGLSKCGLATWTPEMASFDDLMKVARGSLNKKRRLHVVLYEGEEFFARIVENMLNDPKYHLSWVRSEKDVRALLEKESGEMALLMLSLNRDPKQWQLLLDLKQKDELKCPILLFHDVALTPDLRNQLRQLGVTCVVNKGISHEELVYIVQSLIIPKVKLDERKSPRTMVRVPLVYEFHGRSFTSTSFTLSRDGIFIRDMNPPVAGTWVKLKVFIPGQSEPIETEGEVVYAIPYFVGVNRFHVSGMAIRFLNLSEDRRQLLEQFVNSCLKSYMLS
jgi:DNA-binding response OmpR family regulator